MFSMNICYTNLITEKKKKEKEKESLNGNNKLNETTINLWTIWNWINLRFEAPFDTYRLLRTCAHIKYK